MLGCLVQREVEVDAVESMGRCFFGGALVSGHYCLIDH